MNELFQIILLFSNSMIGKVLTSEIQAKIVLLTCVHSTSENPLKILN